MKHKLSYFPIILKNLLLISICGLILLNCSRVPSAKSEFAIEKKEFQSNFKKIAIFPTTFFFSKLKLPDKKKKNVVKGGTFSEKENIKQEAIKDEIERAKEKRIKQYGTIDENLTVIDKEIMFRLICSKAFKAKEVMVASDTQKIISNIMRKMRISHFYKNDGVFDKSLFLKFIKKFCDKTKSDAVMISFLEIVIAKVKKSEAEWDGKSETFASEYRVEYFGTASALSLASYLIDSTGKYIWEGRGGIGLLEKKEGAWGESTKKLQDIYRILANNDRRRRAIKNVFYSFKTK